MANRAAQPPGGRKRVGHRSHNTRERDTHALGHNAHPNRVRIDKTQGEHRSVRLSGDSDRNQHLTAEILLEGNLEHDLIRPGSP